MAAPKKEDPTTSAVEPKTVKVVKYVGQGSEKILTEKDFHDNGVHNQKGARWYNFNGYKVPADYFTEEALAFVLAQPTVELIEVDADGTQV